MKLLLECKAANDFGPKRGFLYAQLAWAFGAASERCEPLPWPCLQPPLLTKSVRLVAPPSAA
jgi:hypothetical protein